MVKPLSLLGVWVHVSTIFTKENDSSDLPFASMGSTLKGIGLLLEEQVLSYRSWSPLKSEAKLRKAGFSPESVAHSP